MDDVKLTYPVWMAIICIAIGLRLLCTRRVRWYECDHMNTTIEVGSISGGKLRPY
ncbi:MAG: hypothetical protein ACLTJG_02270 [[Clostridium] innocuum]